VVPGTVNAAGLQRCLEALAAQDYRIGLISVSVVDNEPDAAVEPLAIGFGARYLWRTRGFVRGAKCRRAGVESRGLAFTDSDCLPDTGWLSAGVACQENPAAWASSADQSRFPRDPARPTPLRVTRCSSAINPVC
jgi:GT2 family glycosyltransferase